MWLFQIHSGNSSRCQRRERVTNGSTARPRASDLRQGHLFVRHFAENIPQAGYSLQDFVEELNGSLERLPRFAGCGGLALQLTAPSQHLPGFDALDVKRCVAVLER